MIAASDAVLALTFPRPPDHGSSESGFITAMEPIVPAELRFGDREPAGMAVKEPSRSNLDNTNGKTWSAIRA